MQGKAIQTSAPGVLCNCMIACATWSGLAPLVRRVQRMPMSANLSPMMEVSLQAYSYNMPRPLNDDIRLLMFLDLFISENDSSRAKATLPTMAGSDSGGIPALNGRSVVSTPTNSSVSGSGSNGCSAAGSTASVGADGVPGVFVPEATRSARTRALKRERQHCSELNAQALHPTVGPYLMIRSRVLYSFCLPVFSGVMQENGMSNGSISSSCTSPKVAIA